MPVESPNPVENLTDLQKRILVTALVGEGRIILWVLGSGIWVMPGFREDIAHAIRALEKAGLLAPHDATGRIAPLPETRPPGWYVVELTEAGWKAANEATGRNGSAGSPAA